MFQDIECPLIIQGAIGGDVELFKYLVDKGFFDYQSVGHIALSKKQKNSVITNVIGAAAYYGREEMLKYLLKNYDRKLDVNIKASEKKGKKKHSTLIREYTGFNPLFLAIAGDISQDKSIAIMKILDEAKININDLDFRDNNILHIASRFSKLNVVKNIMEDLELDSLAKETNKDGQTPYSIAESVDNKAICDYLRNNTEKNDQQIEDELKELIESKNKTSGKSKKNKKKKKGRDQDDNDLGLLNSTDYQETQKIEPKKVETPSTRKVKEEVVEEEEEEENETEYPSYSKKYEQDTYDNSTSRYQRGNGNYRQYQGGYGHNNYRNKQYNRGQYHNDDYYGNKNYYNNQGNKGYYKRNNNYKSNNQSGVTLKEVEISSSNNNQSKQEKYLEEVQEKTTKKVEETKKKESDSEEEKDVIVGLPKKNKRKNKKNKEQKTESKEEKVEPKETKEDKNKPTIEIEQVEITKQGPELIETVITEVVIEKETEVKPEPPQQDKKEEHEIICNDFRGDDEEEEEEYDDDFLPENETDQKEKLKVDEKMEELKSLSDKPKKIENLIETENKVEYKELLDKYIALEKKYELLFKEKEEMENFLRKSYQKQLSSSIPSTSENINDLLDLANSELAEKNKKIEELEKKLEMYTSHEIQSD